MAVGCRVILARDTVSCGVRLKHDKAVFNFVVVVVRRSRAAGMGEARVWGGGCFYWSRFR